jgi:hypothetical protein
VLSDPLAARELQKRAALEAPLRAEVHVFDTRRMAKAGELQESRELPVVPGPLFALEQEREAVFEGEGGRDPGGPVARRARRPCR